TDLAVVPAGTANLFATNLGIPCDIPRAVAIGLRGRRRTLDVGRFRKARLACLRARRTLGVGRFRKERFAVMAGAGFDADMMRDADDLKERIGRAAYVCSGTRHLRGSGFGARIEVDGAEWYDGRASMILLGNLGDVFGGIDVLPDAPQAHSQTELRI